MTHRAMLFGVAYRMLGRVTEADDMVQETWLRWQRQDSAELQSPKAWLISTITRLCIDQLRAARRTREEYYGVWLPEPLVDASASSPGDTAAVADSLGMAFMVMLETLSPVERSVFLLHEIFDHDYADIARIVDKTEANCRQIVRRAKQSLGRSAAMDDAPATPRAMEVAQQFLAATRTGDVADLLALLTDDAVLYTDGGGRVVAAGRPIHTADRVSRFFVGVRSRAPADQQIHFVTINGGPGVIVTTGGRIDRVISVELAGERVRAIYLIRNPEKLRHVAFLLPVLERSA